MRDRLSWTWTLCLSAFAGSGIWAFLNAIRAGDALLTHRAADPGFFSDLQIVLLAVVVLAGGIVGVIGSAGFAIGVAGNAMALRYRWIRWRNRKMDLVREIMES